jgi:hypothetical protein
LTATPTGFVPQAVALRSDSVRRHRLMTMASSVGFNEVMAVTKLHADIRPAEYYLQTARSLRARVPDMRYREARDELSAMALEYERLARFVELKKPLSAGARP